MAFRTHGDSGGHTVGGGTCTAGDGLHVGVVVCVWGGGDLLQ